MTGDFPYDIELVDAVDDIFISAALSQVEDAVEVQQDQLDAMKERLMAWMAQDRLLVADIEDLFAEIDPASLLDDVFTAESPEASAAAYEQLVTGEWDGEL